MGCPKIVPKGNLSEMVSNWQISIGYEDNQIMTMSNHHTLHSRFILLCNYRDAVSTLMATTPLWTGTSSVSACHESWIYQQVSGKALMQNDRQACQTQSQAAYPQALCMQVECLDTAGQIGIVGEEVGAEVG